MDDRERHLGHMDGLVYCIWSLHGICDRRSVAIIPLSS